MDKENLQDLWTQIDILQARKLCPCFLVPNDCHGSENNTSNGKLCIA